MIAQVEKSQPNVWSSAVRVGGRLLVALVITFAGYLLLYRPLQLRRGSTAEEVACTMPGDEIQPHPTFNATRAVSIDASPDQIWPWLMQIGYKRADWYGYDFLDNGGIPSVDRLIPDFQQMEVGDNLPIWEGVNVKVVAVEPNRYLVWQSYDTANPSSWTLGLYPIDATHTRLVWRIHNAPYDWTSPTIGPLLFTDLADIVAVRQNMLGIKSRAEGVNPEAEVFLKAEIALWVAAFLAFGAAIVGFIVRKDWLRPIIAVAVTGLITVGLVLIKPPVWVDGLFALAVWLGLGWLYWPTNLLSKLSRKPDHRFSS